MTRKEFFKLRDRDIIIFNRAGVDKGIFCEVVGIYPITPALREKASLVQVCGLPIKGKRFKTGLLNSDGSKMCDIRAWTTKKEV